MSIPCPRALARVAGLRFALGIVDSIRCFRMGSVWIAGITSPEWQIRCGSVVAQLPRRFYSFPWINSREMPGHSFTSFASIERDPHEPQYRSP